MYNFATPIEELAFAVTDIETSGMAAWDKAIVEIGAVTIDPPLTLNTGGVFERLINPKGKITLETQAVHGISDLMVADAEFIEPVIEQFAAFVEGRILVFHNAPFDYGFISRVWGILKMRPNIYVLDTLKLSRKLNRGLKHHSLDDLIAFYGIKPLRTGESIRRHRALYDADMTAVALLHMLEQLDRKGIFTFGDLFHFHG